MTPFTQKTGLKSVCLVDFENIMEIMKNYSANPIREGNFFPVLLDKFKNMDLNVIECICYGNFKGRPQTMPKNLGIETRQCSHNGKNSGDIEMTVDALRILYKSPVDVFILISSDRDIIPLIKAVRQECKIAYVLSTRINFNPIVTRFSDIHEFLEDIFGLTSETAEPTLTDQEDDKLGAFA